MPGILLTIAFVVFVVSIVVYQVLTNLIYICSPNEVLIFSGGGKRGYRVVKGGRATRIPFLEAVDRMDLTNMNIEVSAQGAYSRGGIPLNIMGVANVKIAGESPHLDNAIQRLLGKPRNMIMRIAKQTLEGYLRGVLATLSPEEVNENTQTFERELRKQAGEGFDRLGLTLDNLKIQSIGDDRGYLAAMGRIRGAELSRDNRVAEASRRADSLEKQADSRRKGELAKIEAQLNIAGAESTRRQANALSAQAAYVAEQEGEVKALLTRAEAELELQTARIKQAKHQLEAEIVTPARARMEAQIAKARGDAASILENGRAQADVLKTLAHEWRQAGESARDVFLLQKLEAVLPTFLDSIRRVRINEVTMLQGGGDDFAGKAVATVKALEAGGVNISDVVARLAGTQGRGHHAAPAKDAVGLSTPAKADAAPAADDAAGRLVRKR